MDILVDTSVWSLALRRRPGALNVDQKRILAELHRLVDEGRARLIGPIRQEILSGIRDSDQYERLRQNLRAFPDGSIDVPDFETAARFSNICRAKGIAGSAVDFLICAVAADRKWPIYTEDGDFREYSRLLPIQLYGPRD